MTKFVFKVWLAVAAGILVGSIIAHETIYVIIYGAVLTAFGLINLIIIQLLERLLRRKN